MKKINLKSTVKMVVILGVLLSLLLCLNGCKDQPVNPTIDNSANETTPQNTTPSETTVPVVDTQPTTEATQPTYATIPTEETAPNDCVHKLGNWVVEKASTCTTEGVRYKACVFCKYKIEIEAIPIVSHAAGNWIVDVAATCTSEGAQHQECAQCRMPMASIVVSKLDHKTFTIRGYAPTTSTPGLTQGHLCSICGSTVQDQYQISPLGSIGLTYTVNADGKSCTITGMSNRRSDSLILPDSLNGYTITAISDGAFSGCTMLKTVYLPDTVTSIGAQAFRNCINLTNITYEGTTLQWLSVVKNADWNASTGNYNIYCKNNHLSK